MNPPIPDLTRTDSNISESDLTAAINRTAARFLPQSRRAAYSILCKLRIDPATRQLSRLAPFGHVLDLGCGRGQSGILLLEMAAAQTVRGWDWDSKKITAAARAAKKLSISFEQKDLLKWTIQPIPPDHPPSLFDTILLMDVLHYFEPNTQDTLLHAAIALLQPGGRLILRDPDIGQGWRSRLTRLADSVAIALRFYRAARVYFRDIPAEILPLLRSAGMHCTLQPSWRRTPFANVLVVAQKQ